MKLLLPKLVSLSLLCMIGTPAYGVVLDGPFPKTTRYLETTNDNCRFLIDTKVYGDQVDTPGYDYFGFRFVDNAGTVFQPDGSMAGGSAKTPGFGGTDLVAATSNESRVIALAITLFKGAVVDFPIRLELYEAVTPTGSAQNVQASHHIANYTFTRQEFYQGFKNACPGFYVSSPVKGVKTGTVRKSLQRPIVRGRN